MKKLLLCAGLLAALAVVLLLYGWQKDREPSSLKETNIEQANEAAPSDPLDAQCPHMFMSWNIADLGRSKTDEEIEIMAKTLAPADIVAIQEVVAGKDFGAQAVAKLVIALGRTGAAWDYIVSDPTNPPSAGVERYAYLFKPHMVLINRDDAHLVSELERSIDREPYTLSFRMKKGSAVRIFTIHTVPTAKGPIDEVRALIRAKEITSATRAIVAGDFNLSAKKTDPYLERIGFTGHITEPTSLKRSVRSGGYVLYQYDNIYTKGVAVCKAGTVDFVEKHFGPVTDESLSRARRVSDHLPVFVTFR